MAARRTIGCHSSAGRAWTLDPATDQYYLHSFLREQPDLNWRNPEVREAMFDVLRFWLDRGVDGFRVDVIWLLIKDDQFRDNPPNPAYRPTQPDINRTLSVYNADRPEIHELIAEMRAVLDSYGDRVLIGEIYLPFERLVDLLRREPVGRAAAIQFRAHSCGLERQGDCGLDPRITKRALPAGRLAELGARQSRPAAHRSRVGEAQARIAAMLLLTLRGTPTMYYGDEIGMARTESRPSLRRSMGEERAGAGRRPRSVAHADAVGRQRQCRLFDQRRHGCRSTRDYKTRNVSVLRRDPCSILSFYRRLIELRRTHVALQVGDLANIAAVNNVLTYERVAEGQRIKVILNFGPSAQAMPGPAGGDQTILLSTHMDRKERTQPDQLRPNEGIVLVGPALTLELASFEQVVEPADTIPTVAIRLQADAVLAVL